MMSLKLHLGFIKSAQIGLGIILCLSLGNQSPGRAQDLLPPSPFTPDVDATVSGPLDMTYVLGPGDRIKIDTFGAPEYSGEALVLTDGSLNLPRIGRVVVQGMTLEQASEAIAAQYAPYLRRPLITITPLSLKPVRVAIAGEVNRPGSYTMPVQSGNNNTNTNTNEIRFPSLTEAIQMAGGITASANIREVQISRPTRVGPPQTVSVNLWDLIQTGDLSRDVMLQAGDTVFIPTATAINPEEAADLGSANFSPATIRVYVAGEVESPGAIELPPNTPLNQALLAAGGFNERAKRGSVQLVRLNPNGTVAQQEVEVDFAQGIDAEGNPALRNQDVIIVGRSGIASFSDSTNLILGPVGRILGSIFGLFNLF